MLKIVDYLNETCPWLSDDGRWKDLRLQVSRLHQTVFDSSEEEDDFLRPEIMNQATYLGATFSKLQ